MVDRLEGYRAELSDDPRTRTPAPETPSAMSEPLVEKQHKEKRTKMSLICLYIHVLTIFTGANGIFPKRDVTWAVLGGRRCSVNTHWRRLIHVIK